MGSVRQGGSPLWSPLWSAGSGALISSLLPPAVAAVEAFDDAIPAPLLPEEELLVARAVDKRRREFATGRRCARAALARFDIPEVPIVSGPGREPLWPSGIVGSITHCAGYRAAAVAHRRSVSAIGIDAEPHEPLPADVRAAIALPQERERLDALACARPDVHWDRLLFCAKEAVYKVWYPLAGRWLGFEQADIVLDAGRHRFVATLLIDGPDHCGQPLRRLSGRFLVGGELILAAIALDPV